MDPQRDPACGHFRAVEPNLRRSLSILALTLAAGCADLVGPPPSSYQVSTDKDEYDAAFVTYPGNDVLAYSLEYFVDVDLTILNRGDAPLILFECDWGAGAGLVHARLPADSEPEPDEHSFMSDCPDLGERFLGAGEAYLATVRLYFSGDVWSWEMEREPLVVSIATHRGPIRSAPFRVRFPGDFRVAPPVGPIPPRESPVEPPGTTVPIPRP